MVCMCFACVLPWNAALVEELASAGEELLERELKGDCLKHSSRNGLKHRNMMHDTNTYTAAKLYKYLRCIQKIQFIAKHENEKNYNV